MGQFSKLILTCLFLGFAKNSLAFICSNWGHYQVFKNTDSNGYFTNPQKECPDSHPVCPALCGECMTHKDWGEVNLWWHSSKCNVINHAGTVITIGGLLGLGRKKRSSDPNCLEQISKSKTPLDLKSECKEYFLKAEQRIEGILENTEKRLSLLKQLEDLD